MRTRFGTRATRPACALALAGALLLGACTDTDNGSDTDPSASDDPGVDDPDTDEPAPDDPDAGEPGGEAPDPVDYDLPDTPPGEHMAWLLSRIHPDAERLTPGQIADRIGPPLSGLISPGQLLGTLDELSQRGPWELIETSGADDIIIAELRGADDSTVLIHLVAGDEGRMAGLFIADGDEERPGLPADDAPSTDDAD